jgi:hypothetical protein
VPPEQVTDSLFLLKPMANLLKPALAIAIFNSLTDISAGYFSLTLQVPSGGITSLKKANTSYTSPGKTECPRFGYITSL